MPKNNDWIGNNKSIYSCLGASNHTEEERQVDDYYATEPKAVELLLENEKFSNCVLEPACGQGHISEVLKQHGYQVISTDLIDRGYGQGNKDFFEMSECNMDIITNPPYKYAKEFVKHALDIVPDGTKIAMFLKLTFLESKSRKELFLAYPFKTLYVSSNRLRCAKNGDFKNNKKSAVAYGWYVWEKGYKGEPIIKWIN